MDNETVDQSAPSPSCGCTYRGLSSEQQTLKCEFTSRKIATNSTGWPRGGVDGIVNWLVWINVFNVRDSAKKKFQTRFSLTSWLPISSTLMTLRSSPSSWKPSSHNISRLSGAVHSFLTPCSCARSSLAARTKQETANIFNKIRRRTGATKMRSNFRCWRRWVNAGSTWRAVRSHIN